MDIRGKKLICDRCRAEVFLEHKGNAEEFGYKVGEVYEAAPEGWAHVQVKGIWFDVCPFCNELLDQKLRQFAPGLFDGSLTGEEAGT